MQLRIKQIIGIVIGLMLIGSTAALAKDKVVLSLQQDPAEDGLEAACVALQLGTGLLKSAKEKAKVTIFATLDGVYIADENTYGSTPICETFKDGVLGEAPLRGVLNGFLNAGGEVLLCPLCFAVRQDGVYQLIEDSQIYVANPIPLLLEANKVIDY
jgi:predicted peroxiredoxin